MGAVHCVSGSVGMRGTDGVEGTQGGGDSSQQGEGGRRWFEERVGDETWVLNLALSVCLAISSRALLLMYQGLWGKGSPFSRIPTIATSSSPHQTLSFLNFDLHILVLTELSGSQAHLCHLLLNFPGLLYFGIWQVPRTKFS